MPILYHLGVSLFIMFKLVIVIIPKKEEIRDKYLAIMYKKKKGKSTKKGKQRSASSH